MFTHYALPIDRFIPAPTRRRRLTALLVAAFAASALALGGGASTASAAPSWVTLDTPYANDRALGGRYIETSAYGSFGGHVESTLYQHYGGAWHQVAIAAKRATGPRRSSTAASRTRRTGSPHEAGRGCAAPPVGGSRRRASPPTSSATAEPHRAPPRACSARGARRARRARPARTRGRG